MKKVFALALVASSVFAGKAQFCQERNDQDFVRMQMKNRPYQTAMGFQNQGGLVNGGVCWWHSRFHRNALYLGLFQPNKERPSEEEAQAIIKAIRKGKKVVKIPGYRNLRSFSRDFSYLIQDELEAWQKTDGFINQQWIIGLAGTSKRSASGMKKSMDNLYDYVVKEGNVAYQKLQIKGITAHAWLVVDMKKLDHGYRLSVVDSNFPGQVDEIYYQEGDTHLNHSSFTSFYGDFAPYTGRKSELRKVNRAIKKFCR